VSLDWLTERPIAHRGLHDRARGVIENSMESADAAIAANCAIECDVQMSSDGEAFVFHDEDFARLTGSRGAIRDAAAAQIARVKLSGSRGDGIIPALSAFLARVDRRVPVVIEIKSLFDGDMRLAERTGRIARDYEGAVALKSFDPSIIAHLRASNIAGAVPLGVVAEARFDHPEWNGLPAQMRLSMQHLLHWQETRPDFLSWCVDDLPNAAVHLARAALRTPVMTWTVRTRAQWDIAMRYADQAVFEGPPP
jgi:glycerophosphoryl diester phosphodiesterase